MTTAGSTSGQMCEWDLLTLVCLCHAALKLWVLLLVLFVFICCFWHLIKDFRWKPALFIVLTAFHSSRQCHMILQKSLYAFLSIVNVEKSCENNILRRSYGTLKGSVRHFIMLGQIWTTPNFGLKMSFKNLTQLQLSLLTVNFFN